MTSHDESPRTSKSSSPSEDPDSRIFRDYCGGKELSNPNPLHTKPNAYAEEEETPEDEQRESKLPRDIAEDDPILGEPRSQGRAACPQRQPPRASQEKKD